jgi:hypothetical protein
LAIDPTAPAVDPDAEKSDADATIVEDPEQADPPQEQDPSPTLTPEQSTTAPKERKKKPPPAPPPRQGRRFWRLGSGGDFVITGGAANKALVGSQFHLMSEWLLSEYFAPTLRLSGSYQESSAIDGPVGRALFQLYGGAIEVCPLRVAFGVPTIRPCLSTAVGGLRGKGVDVPDGVSEVKDYATVGMTGRLELPVHRLISLEAGFGAHFPLRRDRFVLANDVVSQAQVVTGKGNVGLLIWFF